MHADLVRTAGHQFTPHQTGYNPVLVDIHFFGFVQGRSRAATDLMHGHLLPVVRAAANIAMDLALAGIQTAHDEGQIGSG